MMHYFIGIDGGGSRSRLAAVNKQGEIVGCAVGGSTNIAAETYEGVFANIQKLLDEFIASSGVNLADCQGICIGSAGASTGENAKLLERIFRELGYTGKLTVMNDAELVLLAETKGDPGAIIISGTGSVGYAVDEHGEVFRAGGWGHLIDDAGSGYRMGMDAIKAALMDFDGRGGKTLLTKAVTEFFGCDSPSQLTGYIYGNDFSKAKVAEVAMLVREAATQGDSVAIAIEQQAAQDLISLANTLINRARLTAHKLVLSGSVLLHNEHIRGIFECAIRRKYPEMQIVEMNESAEMGAAHLAMKGW